MALGSYARRELCPGSDVDAMLLVGRGRDVVVPTEELWYPFWDAGFDLGHSTRTLAEAQRAADDDVDTFTALLDARHVAGDVVLTERLIAAIRSLAVKRRRHVVGELAERFEARGRTPGPIAEMLEPDLKEGQGGLRDVQAPAWVGWALGAPGGTAALVAGGYLEDHHPAQLAAAQGFLLDVRVALQRVTAGASDRLHLQEQDAVARMVGSADADDLLAELAEEARAVVWIAGEAWDRLRSSQRGPLGRLARRDKEVEPGVILRDGRITIDATAPVSGALVLRAAAAAAERGAPIDRVALSRFEGTPGPAWDAEDRGAFFRLLAAGRAALPVFEALDHFGLLVTLLPEWRRVRSRPQRNAYHRFTVDRHLLEAVAECAQLLAEGAAGDDGHDAEVARSARRPELLLLAALLHDIGKGTAGDHSERGADLAARVCRRIGLDVSGTGTVVWLVLHHLYLADVATRRDLSEEATIGRVANAAGNPNRLRLLYLLTVGDSRATGPAAWGPAKVALVRELYTKAATLLARGDAGTSKGLQRREELAALIGDERAADLLDSMPPTYALAFDAETMARHEALLRGEGIRLRVEHRPDGVVECTVVAPDRPGLLAAVAGVLTLSGVELRDANVFSRDDGIALQVFRGLEHFDRLREPDRVTAAERLLVEAVEGEADLASRVRDHVDRYQRPSPTTDSGVMIELDLEASDFATVVEVHAPDRVGLLYELASALFRLGLDVTVAKVATLGERVIDTFYVRDPTYGKVTDSRQLERIRATLVQVSAGALVAGDG